VLFPLGVFGASASWQLVLAGSGLLLGRTLSRPGGRRVVAAISGVIMLTLAANLAWPD
jgi:arginine exporter protein ArgO